MRGELETPRQSSEPTDGIVRARRGLGSLQRGRGMLGERRSEVGASNAIEHLPLHGRDGVLREG